jgi:Ser-tRNA(Ala) deacylase AlaX
MTLNGLKLEASIFHPGNRNGGRSENNGVIIQADIQVLGSAMLG